MTERGGGVVPAPSVGTLGAPLGDAWAAYDFATREVVVVSALAGWVLRSSGIAVAEAVTEAADVLGVSPEDVEAHIRGLITELTDCGLMGREGTPHRSVRLAGQAFGGNATAMGSVHRVLDERLVFRSSDAGLLAEIDDYLGTAEGGGAPTVVFDVEPDGAGVVLRAAEEWRFPDREGFFWQLPGVINDFASHDTSMLVLHAGGVRMPDGRVLVLPGIPEAGKSTLTGALVQRGCDYLGDEIVGVREGSLLAVGHARPLVLDARSRDALGLIGLDGSDPHVPVEALNPGAVRIDQDAGRVAGVVLPMYEPAAGPPRTSVLTPFEALEQMLPSVMNLEQGLEVAWRALCQLASNVTVTQITHSSSCELADLLLQCEPEIINP